MIVDWHAGFEERLADASRLGGNFPGMVEVRLNVDFFSRGQQIDEFVVEQPLW